VVVEVVQNQFENSTVLDVRKELAREPHIHDVLDVLGQDDLRDHGMFDIGCH
jgi:hypothetical protein